MQSRGKVVCNAMHTHAHAHTHMHTHTHAHAHAHAQAHTHTRARTHTHTVATLLYRCCFLLGEACEAVDDPRSAIDYLEKFVASPTVDQVRRSHSHSLPALI